MNLTVAVVDDEPHLRNACQQALELAGISAVCHAHAESALETIAQDWPGIVVTDIKMPGMSGLELMDAVLRQDPQLPVILITGHGDVEMAVSAMQHGAYDFMEKPFDNDRFVSVVARALDKRRLVLENRDLIGRLAARPLLERSIIGRSRAMATLRETIASYAATDADVLVQGETGTGKELVARSLHALSTRKDAPFVSINCGALPETIIESELFGHEAGAFTGAGKLRIGKFEYASGGTIFLDEIESMPLDMQTQLLRVLQERVVVRLGSNTELPIDIRVIAAAKADLKKMSDRGSFRADLYYRLSVLTLEITPLRERREDIPLMFAHFLQQAQQRFKKSPPEPGIDDIQALINHDWPGNIRELENVSARYALGLGIESAFGAATMPVPTANPPTLTERLSEVERTIIAQALAHNGGRLKQTYEQLGISRKTLYDKIKRYGLGAAVKGETS